MMVKGKHDDIAKFYNAMSQNGNIYMGRGAEAEIDYDDNYDCEGHDRATIDGWCKWSIQSALYDNAISMRREPEMWHFGGDVDKTQLEFITFVEASKRWNLEVEVYSEEPGCCFQEHYIVRNGVVEVDDCIEWNEYWVDYYETKEEAEAELEMKITDEEWEEGLVQRGGFGAWEFEI
jgi:hypothetical protein